MNWMKKIPFWEWVCWVALGILLVVNSLHLLRGDVFFNTDIARDFMMLEEMVANRKISLIGGHSGVGGIFHGPIWYWFSLPFFVLFGGSPALMGLVWELLYLASVVGGYFMVKKMLGRQTALLSTTLWATLTVFFANGMTQNAPSILLSLLFFFCLHQYFTNRTMQHLLIGLVVLGIIIQCEIAFGLPILLVTTTYLLWDSYTQRRFGQLWALLVLILPLSTYLLFEVRHDFLQLRGAIQYAQAEVPYETWTLEHYLRGRLRGVVESFAFLRTPVKEIWYGSGVIGMLALGLLWIKRQRFFKSSSEKTAIRLGVWLVVGFWIATLPFKGDVQSHYYAPLLPILIMLFVHALTKLKHQAWMWFVLIVVVVNTGFAAQSGWRYWLRAETSDFWSWRYYRRMAQDIVTDSQSKPFGYYAWSSDLFGYAGKYAMRQVTRHSPGQVAFNQKLPLSYAFTDFNNASYNPFANPQHWLSEQVGIAQPPTQVWQYAAGGKVYRYQLDEEAVAQPNDPNLIEGTFFR